MKCSLEQRVLNVRNWLRADPPPAWLSYAVLNRWTLGKDTQEIADRLDTTQAEVCRIIVADQDCRRALVRATA